MKPGRKKQDIVLVIRHLGIAVFLLLLIYTIYVFFSKSILHPEKMSPFVYLVVILIGFLNVLRSRIPFSFRGYIWIPLLALFGLLEETSYGMEQHWFEPFTLGDPNLVFQDLHNFMYIFFRWAERRLGLLEWNQTLFLNFLIIDLVIVIFCLYWLFSIRIGSSGLGSTSWRKRVLRYTGISSAGISIICMLWLITIPIDPKNVFLLGLSLARFLGLAFLILATGFAIGIVVATKKELPSWVGSKRKVKKSRWHKLGYFLFPFLLFCGFIYQFFLSFGSSGEDGAVAVRIAPLVGWVMAQIALLFLGLLCWLGHLRQPTHIYTGRFFSFFAARPPLIYTLFAIGLIIIAEALDRDFIVLPDTSTIMSGSLARNWHVWTEETFELIAAIQLGAASFFFPKPAKRSNR